MNYLKKLLYSLEDKEMDILLSKFVKKHVNVFDYDQLKQLENF